MWNSATFWTLVSLRVAGVVAALVVGLLATDSMNVLVASYVAVAVVDAVFGLVVKQHTSDTGIFGKEKWYRVIRILLFATFAMAGMWVASWEPTLILVTELAIYVGIEWWKREKSEKSEKSKKSKKSKKNGTSANDATPAPRLAPPGSMPALLLQQLQNHQLRPGNKPRWPRNPPPPPPAGGGGAGGGTWGENQYGRWSRVATAPPPLPSP